MPTNAANAERILILAPTGRDAALAVSALESAGFDALPCIDIDDLCTKADEAAGALMITAEALTTESMDCLRALLARQPAWSDLPLLVFTSEPAMEVRPRSFERLGGRANVTLVERPIRVKTMVSAVETALRARRRQYEVRDLLRELEQRIEERDNFLAMLSHELRNPLAAITLAINQLENDQPENDPLENDPQKKNETAALRNERAIVVRQTRHLTKLVDDLLDISRVTSGKISLNRTEVDLGDLIEHCTEAAAARASARGLTLSLHPPPEQTCVNGDTVRIEQIVNNLLSNALKYTPSGGTIDIFVERDGDDAVIRVRDTGKGIAADMLTRIFDIFTQGDVTIDRSEGGMGIGLTLVQKLVELHGGSVRAYSGGKGSGSEFVVRLPLLHDVVVRAAPKAVTRSGAVAGRRIVIVEDNADIRELLRIKLRHLGHQVEVAEDGVKGLETILRTKPDLALVDIGLPGLDGYGIAQRVRETMGDDVHLVALTGYGQAEDRRKALDAGFNVHLTKPADIVDVQNVIGNLPDRRVAP